MPETNTNDNERLFLLELLVESIEIDYGKFGLGKNDLKTLKQACVRFQFFNYPPLEICEEDFCKKPQNYQGDKIDFKSGKSCLFSLRGIPPDIRNFDICGTVLREKECTPKNQCIELGKTKISLGSSFTNILTDIENENAGGSVSKTSKDTHPIFNEKGEVSGKMTVFVRLSCFGKMIITQFQVSGDENRSFLFKEGEAGPKGSPGDTKQNTVSDPYIRCDVPTPSGDAGREMSNVHGFNRQVIESDNRIQGTFGDPSTAQGQFQQDPTPPPQQFPMFPQEPAQFPPGFPPVPQMNQPMGGGPMMQEGFPGGFPLQHLIGPAQRFPMFPPGMPPSGFPQMSRPMENIQGKQTSPDAEQFKEIGVEINGHSLSIKVPKKKKKPKPPPALPMPPPPPEESSESSSETDAEEAKNQQSRGDIQFCSCDIPLPPGFEPQAPPKKKKKKKKDKKDTTPYCWRPDCPVGLPQPPNMPPAKPGCIPFNTPPGAIGLQGDQVIFQMPTGNQPGFATNPMAEYTFGGQESNLQKIHMLSDPQAAVSGNPDALTDVFLLKVGKKNLETGQRSTMNLEVKSPRKVEMKTKDVFVQCETEKADKGKDGKKGGKKDKKGKKGKGKKK